MDIWFWGIGCTPQPTSREETKEKCGGKIFGKERVWGLKLSPDYDFKTKMRDD